MPNRIIVSPVQFEISPHTRQLISKIMEPLLHQDVYVRKIEVTLEGKYPGNTQIMYNVTASAQLRTEFVFVNTEGEKILPAVEDAARALERRLQSQDAVR